MKIISIRQPWAALIVSGLKDVENRTWPTRYRGPILVHASQRPDNISLEDIERRFGVSPPSLQPLGGVVGIADVVDCVRMHDSKWHAQGNYAFVLANARPLPFVRWKGALSLRSAPAELLKLCGLSNSQDDLSDALTVTTLRTSLTNTMCRNYDLCRTSARLDVQS